MTYVFHVGEESFHFPLQFDPQSLALINDDSGPLPAWTRLDYRQCEHCPLSPETTET